MTSAADRIQRAEPIATTGIMVRVGVNRSEMTSKPREVPIMRRRFVLSVVYGLALGLAALTDFPAHAADAVAAGKEKAELCAGCHGDNGISQTENIPSLAAQQDQFIQWQLVFFRSGARKNEQMQPIVEQITNEDIRNLGAYFASLTPPKPRSRTIIPIYQRRARRLPWGGAAPRAIPIHLPEPRPSPALPASARNIWSRRCTTTNQACDPAAPERRCRTSPIPSATRKSPRSRIISRICEIRHAVTSNAVIPGSR